MIEPIDVHRLAGEVLEFVSSKPTSREIQVAALKVAATCIDETAQAQMGAQLRANVLSQYRGKP